MTKAEITNEISRAIGIDKENVLQVVEKFMEVVKDSLGKGENVYLRGFGSFIVKERAEKTYSQHFKEHCGYHPRSQDSLFQAMQHFQRDGG